MSTVALSLLILAVLPIVWSWVSGYFRHQQLGEVCNKNPRAQNDALTQAGARAVAAQKNAWEALVVFIAAIVAMMSSGVAIEQYSLWLWVVVALRFLHGLFYIINQDILRSFAFLGAYGICVYFFVLAL